LESIFDLNPEERDYFGEFIRSEGIPVHAGNTVPDLRKAQVSDWKRVGGRGAYIRLVGDATVNAAYLCQIPPSGELNVEKDISDKIVLVLEGSGSTQMWYNESKKYRIEWDKYSLFKLPPNARYQHRSNSANSSALLVTITSLPLLMNVIGHHDMVFSDSTIPQFWKEKLEGGRYVVDAGSLSKAPGTALWQGFAISNAKTFSNLDPTSTRGAENKSVHFDTGPGLTAHISEFPVGKYKKAHRHGPGAHVVVLSGEGYTLIWRKPKERIKIDWKEGSVFVPPSRWFHQHFNTGSVPARYLAVHSPVEHMLEAETFENHSLDQIEYNQEDPEIRSIYESELSKRNLKSRMDKSLYAQK
jgi:mannose-6-phosphate isomerase-like protein (cupin superfamily)